MFIAFTAITALASLNRETGFLLVLCYIAYFPRQWRQALFLSLVYVGIQLGLHLALGSAPHVLGLTETFQRNLATIAEAIFSNLLFVPLWLIVALAYRQSSPILKRLIWIAMLYSVTILVGAVWQEVRLLLTAFPLVLPVIVRGRHEAQTR